MFDQRLPWILVLGLALAGAAGCGDDDDSDDDGGAGTGGRGGTSGGSAGSSSGTSGSSGKGGSSGSGGTTGTAGAAEGGSAAVELEDGEILQVVLSANSGEIDQGEVATDMAQDAAVLDFAETMVTEHTAALDDGEALASDAGIEPTASTLSADLEAESQSIVTMLQSTPEADFDLAYMQAQVTVHQEVLDLLNETLIPQAQDPDLSAYLEDVKTHVEEHLENAQGIVSDLE
jgi:putative membrane protein